METREIGEADKLIPTGGRTPLELEEKKLVRVVLRGMGEYFGGEKKKLEGMKEFTPGKIKNVALIVSDPEVGDPEVEMIISRVADTIAGKTLANFFGERDNRNVLWLKGEWEIEKENLLNSVGWLGFETVKTEGRNRGYERWYWTEEGKDTRYPDRAALVGAAQRREYGEEEGVEGDELEIE